MRLGMPMAVATEGAMGRRIHVSGEWEWVVTGEECTVEVVMEEACTVPEAACTVAAVLVEG
jgi:hypothetical protein